ncbi:30S ribosomal protein S5 [bacterium]|nr:30S ribosomal protein S5 [bacterium]
MAETKEVNKSNTLNQEANKDLQQKKEHQNNFNKSIKPNNKSENPQPKHSFDKNKKPFVKKENNHEAKEVETDNKENKVKKQFKPKVKFKNPRKETTSLVEKVIEIKRISKTTKGGRRLRFSALVVIGDKKGTVGYGLAKANEVPDALKKAIKKAQNNLIKVKMTRAGSLYHEVTGHSSSGEVLLKPAPEGTGIIAGGPIRAVIELAGYSDIYSKNKGTNSSINMVRATINGLLMQKTLKDVANARDIPVSKLFH